jgi:benzoyl-CoA reductase/2-hydroxyglutaryl-CoA dehydratase subunit BcrC/BadD/HgdB
MPGDTPLRIICASDRSCKPYSIGQIDLNGRTASEEVVKGVLLEADPADPRAGS